MNIKYVMLVFYDIPNNCKSENKQYLKFRKYILSIGFIMLQESVYIKTIRSRDNYYIIRRDMMLAAPSKSNIRSLILTEKVYENIDLISGEVTFREKIVSKKTRVLKL